MGGRPPWTILVPIMLFAAAILFGFADVGADPALIVAPSC